MRPLPLLVLGGLAGVLSLGLLNSRAKNQSVPLGLVQCDPRTPVHRLPSSPTGSFVIFKPGSYVLTKNLHGEDGKHGIGSATRLRRTTASSASSSRTSP